MDNRYYNYGCPPLMNDGRFITDYVRGSTYDQLIRKVNNIKDGTEYRHFLQNNAAEIIGNLKSYYVNENTCSVNGNCLPRQGSMPQKNSYDPVTSWYEELNEKPVNQLDFMMRPYASNATTPMESNSVSPNGGCDRCSN